jgi:hypothetical protein
VTLVVLLVLVVAKVIAAVVLFIAGRRVAALHGTRGWRLAAWMPLGALAMDALGCCSFIGLVLLGGFTAAVTEPDTTSKATSLARSISFGMNVGALDFFLSTLLLVVSAVVFARGARLARKDASKIEPRDPAIS